jgi:pimeloyl-ACP methyl ester carboxylesterase
VLSRLAVERDVVAPDLPGFGGSPPLPAGVAPTPPMLAQAVAVFLDDIGLRDAHAAGNPLGGWIALELAKLGRARSVTALAPAGLWGKRAPPLSRASLWIERRLARLFRPALPALLGTRAGRRVALRDAFMHPARVPGHVAVRMATAYADAPAFDATFREVHRMSFTGGDRIHVPVTVAWPEHDRLLRPGRGQRHEELPAHARIVRLHGCGHVPMWDDPEQVARLLLEGSAPGSALS